LIEHLKGTKKKPRNTANAATFSLPWSWPVTRAVPTITAASSDPNAVQAGAAASASPAIPAPGPVAASNSGRGSAPAAPSFPKPWCAGHAEFLSFPGYAADDTKDKVTEPARRRLMDLLPAQQIDRWRMPRRSSWEDSAAAGLLSGQTQLAKELPMRRLVVGLAFLGLISAMTGCHSACHDCRGGRMGLLHHGGGGGLNGAASAHHYRPPTEPAGGPVGQYAYPYYTIRGPRDFLVDNPPSIGPY